MASPIYTVNTNGSDDELTYQLVKLVPLCHVEYIVKFWALTEKEIILITKKNTKSHINNNISQKMGNFNYIKSF